MKLKPLIIFTGPDGAGKTRLSRAIGLLLTKKGIRVKYARIRGTHTFAYFLGYIFLKRIMKIQGFNLHYLEVRIPRKLVKLWVYLEHFSVIPLIIYCYIARLRSAVIMERSILDFIVWNLTGYDVKSSSLIKIKAFRLSLLLTLKFKPIYVTAGIDTLRERRVWERELIEKTFYCYEILSKALQLPRIDTTQKTLRQSLQEVLKLLDLKI